MRRYRPLPGVRVLGLCGHARHGKDEAARLILKLRPGAERFAFSDALAVECRVHHGMAVRDPRVLQDVGMAFRSSHPGVFLDALYGALEDRCPEVAIITGIRFEDEAQMARDMGGEIIRVHRLNADGTAYVSGDRDPNHAAEAQIERIAFDDMWAAHTLEGLRAKVAAWANAQLVSA